MSIRCLAAELLNHPFTRISKGISLQLILVLTFTLQMLLVTGFVGWLSFRNGQQAVLELAIRLQNEVSDRIRERVDTYLSTPHNANRAILEALEAGDLQLEDQDSLERYFIQLHRVYQRINHISVGTQQGNYLAVRRSRIDSDFELLLSNAQTRGSLNLYRLNEQGEILKLLQTKPAYDPRQRPWYKTVSQSRLPRWSDIYPYFHVTTLGISYSSPIVSQTGELQGVIATDFDLQEISDFLERLAIQPTAQTFILDRQGLLVATSTSETLFNLDRGQTLRQSAVQSRNRLTQDTARYLLQTFKDLHSIQGQQHLTFRHQQVQQFLQVTPIQSEFGIDWLLVVVTPETEFTSQINANTQQALWLCLSIVLGFLLVGILLYNWVGRSLVQLSQAATERTLALQQANAELQRLTTVDSLTQVANRLRFDQYLAQEWQRSQREQQAIALILVDVDYFKHYNDTYGHPAGDRCLQQIASALSRAANRSTDLVARYGGEEFAMILPSTNLVGAQEVAQRIQQEIAQLAIPHTRSRVSDLVTVSLGITSGLPPLGQGPDRLITIADRALYAAKAAGRNDYRLLELEL